MSITLFNYSTVAALVGGASPYDGSAETSNLSTIQGVQATTVGISYPRIEAYGIDGDGDQVMISRPRAELDISYVFANGVNESKFGLYPSVAGSGVSILTNLVSQEKNYYLIFNQDHQDMDSYSGTNNRVLAFGNGALTRYTFDASVGQPTVASASISALNLLIQPTGSGQILPAVDKQAGTAATGTYQITDINNSVTNYFGAMPGSMMLGFDTGCAFGALLSGNNKCPIQSLSFSIDIPRNEVKPMGWTYPQNRPPQWPITININAEAYLDGLQVDAINKYGCPDSGFNFTVAVADSCLGNDPYSFFFKGAKLDSQTISTRVGDRTRSSFTWTLKVNDLNRDTTNAYFFVDNAYASVVFSGVDYVSGFSPLTFNLSETSFLSIVSGDASLLNNQVSINSSPTTVGVRVSPVDGGTPQDIIVQAS